MITTLVCFLASQAAWSWYQIPFDSSLIPYVDVQANASSKASLEIRDSVLVLQVDTIASDPVKLAGYDGYTADVRVSIPIHAPMCSYDLRALESITFDFRASQPIGGILRVGLGSEAYPDEMKGDSYQSWVTATGTKPDTWTTVTLSASDFFPPDWVSRIKGVPPLDTVLRYLNSIEISPRTGYSKPGVNSTGDSCGKCTAPTLTKLKLEIRNLTLRTRFTGLKASWMPHRRGYSYSGTFSDTGALHREHGITTFSNSRSSALASMNDGILTLETRFANDSGSTGTVRYSAEAGVSLPFRWDGVATDLTMLTDIDFEIRTSSPITGLLEVQLESDAYPDSLAKEGVLYGVAFKTPQVSGDVWVPLNAPIEDMNTPDWWKDSTTEFPTREEVLKRLRGIRIVPKTSFKDSGATPTMVQQKLEMRNIIPRGPMTSPALLSCDDVGRTVHVAGAPLRQRFDVRYGNGILAVAPPSGYQKIEVVSASGRHVAAFDAGMSRKVMELEPGTWFVVAHGAGKPSLVRTLAVTR